jgi:hypothetical protein
MPPPFATTWRWRIKCQLVKDHAPQNFSLLTKMALNLFRQQEYSGRTKSLRLRRKVIGLDDEARMARLGLTNSMTAACDRPDCYPRFSWVRARRETFTIPGRRQIERAEVGNAWLSL